MKSSQVGGQAVIEGVMMKNKDEYAIAVRKPDQEIVVEKQCYISLGKRYPFFALPIIRGVVNFIESMIIGSKTLSYSASFYEEEETPSKFQQKLTKIFGAKAESIIMGFTMVIAILLAVGIFMILPFLLTELLKDKIPSTAYRGLIEGCIRVIIFIAYVKAISLMEDIKRVFMYHGAEHKTINCIESGLPLTVANVKKKSKEHKRCGTSFMLIVMFVSILFFVFISVDTMWLRMILRLLLIPIIAGVSYEFIRLAGNTDSKIMHILSRPGMWLQRLTTKEPSDDMIEVAIASVEAVFDWETWQEKQRQKDNTQEYEINEAVEVREELAAASIDSFTESDEEEEDEILQALDRFFIDDSDDDLEIQNLSEED